jgi:hypothetical protein
MEPVGTALPPLQMPFASFLGTVSPQQFLPVVVFVVFAVWAVYSIIAAYHWLRYGRSSLIALPVLALHVFISASLALYALSGFI